MISQKLNILPGFLFYIAITTTFAKMCMCALQKYAHLPEVHDDKFYYFGYGSNMLTKRIHIQNPTAVKIGMGLLHDYRLDFNGYTKRWDGAPATIVPTKGDYVYGTLWDIDLTNLEDIDNQEGVPQGHYIPASVNIQRSEGNAIMARAYLLVEQPDVDFKTMTEIPVERRPSKTYLKCLVKGAVETELPEKYISWLRSIPHNNCSVENLENILGLENIKLGTNTEY